MVTTKQNGSVVQMVLAIDPGKRSGWAVFNECRLVSCGEGASQAPWQAVGRVFIEEPRVWRRKTKSPNSIVSVAIDAGVWKGMAKAHGIEPDLVLPVRWKGGPVPKPIQNERDWCRLARSEQAIVLAAAKGDLAKLGLKKWLYRNNHMLDAIGIGLYAIGRRAR